MEKKELQEGLRSQRTAEWDRLPDFPLYMDQMLSYMDRQVLPFDENDHLTAAMVNNYTKAGLVPRAEGKKYTREHIAYLTALCVLKHVLTAKDIDLLLDKELEERRDVREGYEDFRESLGRAMEITADEMEALPDEKSLADAAIHFALMSYASGVACNRYVELLRRREEAARSETAEKKAAKKKGKEA